MLSHLCSKKMEDQCSPLNWAWYYLDEGFEELKHSLLYKTLELEATITCAHEELARKDDELLYLKGVLTKTIKERDDAQSKCQMLDLDNLILQQQIQHFLLQQQQLVEDNDLILRVNSIDIGISVSSSGSDENVVETQGIDHIPSPPQQPLSEEADNDTLALKKPLPENGKFLQAVMEAGPLLQTLLLAGPLPQWQHPPPNLNSIEIPLVTVSIPSSSTTPRLVHQDSCLSSIGVFNNKRCLVESFEELDSTPNIKNQKLVHQSKVSALPPPYN